MIALGIAFKSIKSLNHYKKHIAFSKKREKQYFISGEFQYLNLNIFVRYQKLRMQRCTDCNPSLASDISL